MDVIKTIFGIASRKCFGGISSPDDFIFLTSHVMTISQSVRELFALKGLR